MIQYMCTLAQISRYKQIKYGKVHAFRLLSGYSHLSHLVNSEDPDIMARSAVFHPVFHQDVHCLPRQKRRLEK